MGKPTLELTEDELAERIKDAIAADRGARDRDAEPEDVKGLRKIVREEVADVIREIFTFTGDDDDEDDDDEGGDAGGNDGGGGSGMLAGVRKFLTQT